MGIREAWAGLWGTRAEHLAREAQHHSQRIIAERVAELVGEDPDAADWLRVGDRTERETPDEKRIETVQQVRYLARRQPNVKQALRLYESYILGRGFEIALQPAEQPKELTEQQRKIMRQANAAWLEFLDANRRWWTLQEFGRRAWRDGEQFTRKFPVDGDAPTVRFVDPEEIDDPTGDTKGVVTADGDVADVVKYLRVDRNTATLAESIDAADIFHTKLDVDSTEKRGISRFVSVVEYVQMLKGMIRTETLHRKLQASIVAVRTVKGSPTTVGTTLDNLKTSTTQYPEGDRRREKIRGGTIITVNEGVDFDFKHPDNNFSDASPLAKLLICQVACATGWPYYAISADSADSNFSATLVQESPVVLMVYGEQDFFAREILPIWKWVMEEAIRQGRITGLKNVKFFEEFIAKFRFPSIVTRDQLKDAQTNNIYFMAGAVSRKEMSRRAETDPDEMDREKREEMEDGILGPQGDVSAMNQGNGQKAANQGANQGDGQNQGDKGKPRKTDPRAAT